MYQSIVPILGWVTTLLVCGLAWWKGGPAERLGAAIIVAAAAAVWACHETLAPANANLALLIIDGAMAAGFLVLALRYASPWLGAAMLLQATQFSLHAYYLVIEKAHDRLYSIANNLVTIGVLVSILIGVFYAARRNPAAGR